MLTFDLVIWVMYFLTIYFTTYMFLTFLRNGVNDPIKPSLKHFPTAAIAIPVYNEEESIIDTINSVLALDYPSEKLKIFVVNDASTDKTQPLIEQFLKTYTGKVPIVLINHKENKRKGAALNTALKKTTAEYFICLDADSFIEPLALKNMLPHIVNDKKIGSVLPFIKLKPFKGIAFRLQYIEYLVNFFLKKILGTIDCIHVTPGPFGLYRTKVLHEVGGFHENNLTEDLEMALRLQKHHYGIVQLIDTQVKTLAPQNFKGWYNQRNRWYKGTLFNLFDYRKLFFNTKYGEFGIFQVPMVFIAAVLSIFFAIFVLFERAILPLFREVYDLSHINFDYPLMTKLWFERFHFMDVNLMLIYFLCLVIFFAIYWIRLAHKYGKFTYTRKSFSNTILYVFVYPIFLSLVWLGIVKDLLLRKIQRW